MPHADGVGVGDDQDLILPSRQACKLGRETGVIQDRNVAPRRRKASARRRSGDSGRFVISISDGRQFAMREVRCGQGLLDSGATGWGGRSVN